MKDCWRVKYADCLSEKGQIKKTLTPEKRTEIYKYRIGLLGLKLKPLALVEKANTKIEHMCLACENKWFVSAKTVTTCKSGCPRCAKNEPLLYDDYKKWIRYNRKDIRLISGFVTKKRRCLHGCNVCGWQWVISPAEIMKGIGCGKCANRIRRSPQEYIEFAKLKERNIQLVGEYINANTKTHHRCLKCRHDWYPKPSDITSFKGCPKCANRVFSCLYFWDDSFGNTKIGVTKKDNANARALFVAGRRKEVVNNLKYVNVRNAKKIEGFLLSKYKKRPYIHGDGYTEFRTLNDLEKKEIGDFFNFLNGDLTNESYFKTWLCEI